METELSLEQQVPSAVLTGINISILNDTDAEKVSVLSIETASEVTDPKLGVPNPTSQCATCGAKDVKSCEGHFGVIKFPFTILHPYFISETAQILNKICPGCKSIRRAKPKVTGSKRQPRNCRYCDGGFRDYYPQMNFKVSSNDVFGKTAIIVEVKERFSKKSENRSSGEVLASDYWDIIPKDVQQEESSMKPNRRILSHAQDGRTRAFKKLVSFRGTANELSLRVLDSLRTSKIHSEKLSATDIAPNSTSGLKHIKELLLGKRSDHVFRMVIVGDPNIKLSEIGIPCHIAERLHVSEHLNTWNSEKLNTCCNLRILEKGEIFVRRKDNLLRVTSMDKLQIGDTVLPINSVLSINPLVCSPFRGDFDGDCIHGYVPQSIDSRIELQELVALDKQLINGQSGRNLLSLSHDSLTAAHLVVEDGVVLNLHQMQQLQMFCPRQIQLPAIVKAPLKANPPNTCFWSGKQLFSLLLPPDFDYDFPSNDVRICNGELLSSTDGSSWLRDSEGNLLDCLVKRCQEKSLDFLHAAQEVLCEWLSMRGLSVSLCDLYLSSDSYSRENMIGEVSYALQEAERISHTKLLMVDSKRDFLIGSEESIDAVDFGAERMCYEKQKSAALSQVSVSGFKQVFLGYSKPNIPICKYGQFVSSHVKGWKMPHRLSCAAWNDHKAPASSHATRDNPECTRRFIPCAVVENSFLSGLNPLECFAHAVTTRDISFSDNADLPGTLNRRLMFFMRDLYLGYDGTVRNSYGNQLVQFSYSIKDTVSNNSTDGSFGDSTCGAMGSEPVGSLAACAISEAAYSALDQPISPLESSPLLNLKKVLECGVKKSTGDKTASLFLSKKLGRWTHGFEYAALEVQSHLERLLFSDIVSNVMIFFYLKPSSSRRTCPWVCHFHISKEMAKRRRLNVRSIVDALYMQWNSSGTKSKTNIPKLQITSEYAGSFPYMLESHWLTAPENSGIQLENLQDVVIPYLLGTVVKGFPEFKKVDILWKELPNASRSHRSPGELYLRVFMSEECERKRFWSGLVDSCLEIMDMIDWERSHPDDIHDLTLAYGIDRLKSAISDTGKTILPEHLLLAADCLSSTGEFVALNAKGLADQRKRMSVSAPFTQACFSNPADCLIKAAKKGVLDNLQGSIDALSWGKMPSIGTGGRFDIIYSGKGRGMNSLNLKTSINCWVAMSALMNKNVKVKVPDERNGMSDKWYPRPLRTNGDSFLKGHKSLEISKMIRSFISLKDVLKMSQALQCMLKSYPINHRLSEVDKSIAMMALYFHPRRNEKIGSGAQEIKVGYHSEHDNSRCFFVVLGVLEDYLQVFGLYSVAPWVQTDLPWEVCYH
ncbi:nuclear RNA polymerase D1A [Actinidia rufa]|uniref:DNA-directed RNA polymerase n=1 Tax=Actinidia rufa TaxID=165716 RepID=A0A7J0DE82_9ERIC|nr:nuclear RNA polymerase D1A [Actinidia rufa]